MGQPLARKLALALLAVSAMCLFGCIVGEAHQLYIPLAIIITGCLIALAIAEATQR